MIRMAHAVLGEADFCHTCTHMLPAPHTHAHIGVFPCICQQHTTNTRCQPPCHTAGSSVIRMVHAVLGEADFQSGLRHYFDKHKYGNTITTDLWRAWEQASGKPVDKVCAACSFVSVGTC